MARKDWTGAEVAAFRKLVMENTPAHVIGQKLERTETAIYGKAAALGLSLKAKKTGKKPLGQVSTT